MRVPLRVEDKVLGTLGMRCLLPGSHLWPASTSPSAEAVHGREASVPGSSFWKQMWKPSLSRHSLLKSPTRHLLLPAFLVLETAARRLVPLTHPEAQCYLLAPSLQPQTPPGADPKSPSRARWEHVTVRPVLVTVPEELHVLNAESTDLCLLGPRRRGRSS